MTKCNYIYTKTHRKQRWILVNRVMIWGWFGFENTGDDLLLKTMLSFFCKKENIITIPMTKKYQLNSNINQVSRSYRNLFTGILNNDVLIIGPGGLFPFDNTKKFLLYWAIVRVWKLMNKKVIFFGIGISEKISNKSAYLLRNITLHSDLFITRNPNLLDRIKTPKMYSMSDVVFALNYNFVNYDFKKKSNSYIIGISVVNFTHDTFQKNVNIWIEVVEKLLCDGYRIDLLAFTKGQDDIMIDCIKDYFKDNINVNAIHYKDIEQTIFEWGKYKAVICMRFHSLVLSIKALVPAVPIAYGHKTYTLAKECGLEEYTLKWNNSQSEYYGEIIDVSSSQILNKLALVISDEQKILRLMKNNSKIFYTSANDAFDKLNDVINTEEDK